jgi:hypothetical protein
MSFTVYPKEGEPFCLEFAKFEFNRTNFVFYGSRTSGARPFDHAYMAVAHVAAIVPSRPVSGRYSDERRYRVYLKGRTRTIDVVAHEFDLTGETVSFYWLRVGNDGLERDLVENLYLAKPEVLAIFPVDGLGS